MPVIAPGGLISAKTRPIPLEAKTLPLDSQLFASDALCFLEPASRSLRFEQGDGGLVRDLIGRGGLFGAAHQVLAGDSLAALNWSVLVANAVHFDKPAMRKLAPGERARHRAIYRYFPAG